MSLTVVIPSRNLQNLIACLTALRRNEPNLKKIVIVDDGLDFPEFPLGLHQSQIDVLLGCMVVRGEKPFIYARNCNLGIAMAEPDDDVILLNDDALLQTQEGFTMMQRRLHYVVDYGLPVGLVSAACNNVGNPNQWFQEGGLRQRVRLDPRMVCFVAVLIPRSTLRTVGLLDQRFVGYGLDDDDYCLRVRRAGMVIGIFDGCVVDHASLPSTFRSGNRGGDFSANLAIFREKWGAGNMEL